MHRFPAYQRVHHIMDSLHISDDVCTSVCSLISYPSNRATDGVQIRFSVHRLTPRDLERSGQMVKKFPVPREYVTGFIKSLHCTSSERHRCGSYTLPPCLCNTNFNIILSAAPVYRACKLVIGGFQIVTLRMCLQKQPDVS
jgi:hypothetical protein